MDISSTGSSCALPDIRLHTKTSHPPSLHRRLHKYEASIQNRVTVQVIQKRGWMCDRQSVNLGLLAHTSEPGI